MKSKSSLICTGSFMKKLANYDDPVVQLIRQRRAQMLIHSCLYYEMNESIISDHLWQALADELARLQKEHPDKCVIGFYDNEFKEWDGSTGYHLPLRDPWVYGKAQQILKLGEAK